MAAQPAQVSASPAPAKAPAARLVALDSIVIEHNRVWPRQELDNERVKLFAELYANEPDTVPPVEVCAIQYKGNDKPSLVLVDGMHRYHARKRLHAANISAVLRDDLRTLEDAYLVACQHSAMSSKPLTSKEKRTAVRHVLKTHPKLSDRDIAKIVGCSYMTVNRERNAARRLLGTLGDAMTNGDAAAQRSGPRSIEERAVLLFTSPKAEAPNVAALTTLFRYDAQARAAGVRWARALAAAYDAVTTTKAQ